MRAGYKVVGHSAPFCTNRHWFGHPLIGPKRSCHGFDSHQLIRSKRGERKNDYRTFMQRRILIPNRRCAVFTAKLLPENTHMWPTAIFKTPSDDWPEILLYILGEDIYVVPRTQMPYDTTLDLQSSRIYDYKNSWCVLDGVDPNTSVKAKG